MRPRPGEVVDLATRIALRKLGRRAEYLAAQIGRIDGVLGPPLLVRAPGLLTLPRRRAHTAGILLIAAGDHPERLRSEVAWPTSVRGSPESRRHRQDHRRLSPAGDRQANTRCGISC